MRIELDIVLVDDDELVHEFAQRALRKSARMLTSFEDPLLARESLADATVQLLIVDTKMPGLDGITLIESIDREHTGKVILCSAGKLDAAQRGRTRALGIVLVDKAELYDREHFIKLCTPETE
jgi:DNA-binding NtrC family response regulator